MKLSELRHTLRALENKPSEPDRDAAKVERVHECERCDQPTIVRRCSKTKRKIRFCDKCDFMCADCHRLVKWHEMTGIRVQIGALARCGSCIMVKRR